MEIKYYNIQSLIYSAVSILLCIFYIGNFSNSLNAQEESNHLAFRILEKEAVEYEESLSDNLEKSLARYIPKEQFHLAVRIYWNPDKLDQIKIKLRPLKKKKGKLPGFPIFVREEERSLDYYLGNGSLMRLKVNVILDQALPERYTNFIYKFIPIQARFVGERGDTIRVTSIEFPESSKSPTFDNKEGLPLSLDHATSSLLSSIEDQANEAKYYQPVMIHPVLQKYISQYEQHISQKLDQTLEKYIDTNDFIAHVKFYWNPDELKQLQSLIVNASPEGKVKLPGFTIYLEEEDALYQAITNSTSILKMEVSVLLNTNVPPETEPFLEKVVPITFKFIPERGDTLTIDRVLFPEGKTKEELTKEFFGDEQQQNFTSSNEISESEQDMVKSMPNSLEIQISFKDVEDEFYKGNYQKALDLVQQYLLTVTELTKELELIKMKGSLHFMLQDKALATSAWESVLEKSPDDSETKEILDYLKNER